MNIFVDEAEARACAQQQPSAYEELWWGKKLVGVHVHLPKANKKQVLELLEEAWRMRAPKKVLDAYQNPR